MAFSASDASGWDECLPSVADCTLLTEVGTATIPDHGDLWRVPWQIIETTADSATLRARCFSLPLQLTRSLILSATDTGWRLQLLYSLTNMGVYSVPWSWSAHPLFATQEGDRVVLPSNVHSLRVEGSGSNRLGKNGASISWPVTKLANPLHCDHSEADLSLARCPQSGIGDKLFAGPLSEGWVTLERPSAGLRLTVTFDPKSTPYLGLWLCYGGWPDEPGLKQMCVALEPATAPVDSLAETGSWSRILEPGETYNWPMELQIDRLAPPTSSDSKSEPPV
jgi:galactose mutarotase-like enzyme